MSWPALLVAGWLFGLAHAAHCAAMCGVFALAARSPRSFTAYGLGKAVTYAVLGALAGVLGAVVHAVAHPALTLLAVGLGLMLVLAGFRLGFGAAGAVAGTSRGPLGRWGAAVGSWVGDLRSRSLPGGRFTLGVLTGALPCGAVALALLQASVLGSAPRGSAFMLAFGAGTLPALSAVALLSGPLGSRVSPVRLRQVGGVLVMVAGALTLWRASLPPGTCCP